MRNTAKKKLRFLPDYLAAGGAAVSAPVDVAVMLEATRMAEQLPALVTAVAAATTAARTQGLAQTVCTQQEDVILHDNI